MCSNLAAANDADHTRMRRLLNHAFSDAALRDQEPLLNSHFDLLIQKLYEKVDGPDNGRLNIVHWFKFTTFDPIGDLTFGESFEALKNEEYNFWIANNFQGLKFLRLTTILEDYPLLGMPIMGLMSFFSSVKKAREKHLKYTREKASRRLDNKSDKRDFTRLNPSHIHILLTDANE